MGDDVLEAPYRLAYTYQRSTGPVIGRFLGGLRDQRLEGVRSTAGVDGVHHRGGGAVELDQRPGERPR